MGRLRTTLLAFLLAAASCTGSGDEEILVFVAASLTDAMERLGNQFTEEHGVRVRFNLGGSVALAQQIIRRAPADAFVAAGPEPMDALEERDLLAPGSRVDLLTNELVVVAAPGVAAPGGPGPGNVAALLRESRGKIAIADPDLAPAGSYARQALESLGLWEELLPRLVPAFDVRAALGYVHAGTVELGIVYRTDAAIAGELEVVTSIPSQAHPPIVYPAAVLNRSGKSEAAREFLQYLGGEQARRVFLEYGFVPYNDGS